MKREYDPLSGPLNVSDKPTRDPLSSLRNKEKTQITTKLLPAAIPDDKPPENIISNDTQEKDRERKSPINRLKNRLEDIFIRWLCGIKKGD
jgi:hypothetical protein